MNTDTLSIHTPDGMTYSEASVTVRGRHLIVDGFFSEIYGVSHFVQDDAVPHRNGDFILPIGLTVEENLNTETGAEIGEDVYKSFGFEPYSDNIEQNALSCENERDCEEYEITTRGTVCVSRHGDITLEYSGTAYASLCVAGDGVVTFTCSDGIVPYIRFEVGKPFSYCFGNDKRNIFGSFKTPYSVIVNTSRLSVKKSEGELSVSLGYTILKSDSIIEEAEVEIYAVYGG